MSVIGIIGILIGIVLLIWLTVKGLHVVILAPVCALIVIVMNQMAPVTSLTEVFMGGTVGFMTNMFLVLLIGAIFAQIFEKSGGGFEYCEYDTESFCKGRDPFFQRHPDCSYFSGCYCSNLYVWRYRWYDRADYGISDLSGYVQADEYYQKSGSGAGIYHRRLGDVLTGCTPGGKLSGSAVMRDFFYSRPDSPVLSQRQ